MRIKLHSCRLVVLILTLVHVSITTELWNNGEKMSGSDATYIFLTCWWSSAVGPSICVDVMLTYTIYLITVTDQVHLLTLPHCKMCLGMVWGTWQRVQGLFVLASNFPTFQYNQASVGCAGQMIEAPSYNLQDLKSLPLTFWCQTPPQIFNGLVVSMPRRARAVFVS